jgi:tetratricopeptide (TPR) repeat protein
MLFDLKGRRKRLVQVTYVMLAILFGGGLVLFGVGGNVSGGLVDAFRGGGDSDTTAFSDRVEQAEARAARRPRDPDAWLEVVRAQLSFAQSPEGSDPETGQLTDRGQQAVIEVAQAWERYLRLKPKKIDANAAAFAALAYGALQELDKATKAQRQSVEARPSANGYFELARFAYQAGNEEAGDRAAAEAVRRTPRDLRNNVRSQIAEAKKLGLQFARELKKAQREQRQQARQGGEGGQGQQPGQSFGPLPGAGATGAGGASP